METENNKKPKKKWLLILLLLLLLVIVVFIVWFFFLRQNNNSSKDPSTLYEVGMVKLNESNNLSLKSEWHLNGEISDGTIASATINLDVKLKKTNGQLQMTSINRFSDVVGDYFTLRGMDSGDRTNAWYKEGWLYLQNPEDDYGTAQNFLQDDMFNVYTSGRTLLDKSQIISETVEVIDGIRIITQKADPNVVVANRNSLLGTLANITMGDTEFYDLTLVMKLDKNGLPIEYGMSTSFKATKGDRYEKWTMDVRAYDISTSPVEIEYPDNLDTFEKIKVEKEDNEITSVPPPEKILSPTEQLAMATSLVPPDSVELKDEGYFDDLFSDTYYFKSPLSHDDTVAWFKDFIIASGANEISSSSVVMFQQAFPDGYVTCCETNGVRFILIVEDQLITISFDEMVFLD